MAFGFLGAALAQSNANAGFPVVTTLAYTAPAGITRAIVHVSAVLDGSGGYGQVLYNGSGSSGDTFAAILLPGDTISAFAFSNVLNTTGYSSVIVTGYEVL